MHVLRDCLMFTFLSKEELNSSLRGAETPMTQHSGVSHGHLGHSAPANSEGPQRMSERVGARCKALCGGTF